MAAQGCFAGELSQLSFDIRQGSSTGELRLTSGASAKKCDNCLSTSTPCWRPEKTLDMLLCNACALWWKSKGSLRPTAAPVAHCPRGLSSMQLPAAASKRLSPESSTESRLDSQRGKRQRRARDWGDDIEVYADGHDGMGDWDDSAPVTVEEAAAIIVSFKSAKMPRRLPRRTSESPPSYKGMGVKVTVSLSRKASAPKRGNKNKSCVNCGTTDTPTWRRAGGQFPLCNACGVYRTTHGTNRVPPSAIPLQATTRPKQDQCVATQLPEQQPRLETARELIARHSSTIQKDLSVELHKPQMFKIAALDRATEAGLLTSPAPCRVMAPTKTAGTKSGLNRLLFPTGPKEVLKVHVQAFAQPTRH